MNLENGDFLLSKPRLFSTTFYSVSALLIYSEPSFISKVLSDILEPHLLLWGLKSHNSTKLKGVCFQWICVSK